MKVRSLAILNDTTLYTSDQTVEAAWRVVEPILGDAAPLWPYEPETWGPSNAASVVAGSEGWHDPVAEVRPC